MKEFLLGEHQKLLCALLNQVKQLHKEYLKGVRTQNSEKALGDLHGLLDHSDVKPALDDVLGRTRLDVALLNGQRHVDPEELDAEVSLAKRFGFSSSQVRHHIERACPTSGVAGPLAVKVQTSADLQDLIDRLDRHLRDIEADAPSGFLKLLRQPKHKRKLREAVDGAIFFIGVIVADGLQTAYFRLSYTIAIATFVKLVPNE